MRPFSMSEGRELEAMERRKSGDSEEGRNNGKAFTANTSLQGSS